MNSLFAAVAGLMRESSERDTERVCVFCVREAEKRKKSFLRAVGSAAALPKISPKSFGSIDASRLKVFV